MVKISAISPPEIGCIGHGNIDNAYLGPHLISSWMLSFSGTALPSKRLLRYSRLVYGPYHALVRFRTSLAFNMEQPPPAVSLLIILAHFSRPILLCVEY
jgi:hypothetical protein